KDGCITWRIASRSEITYCQYHQGFFPAQFAKTESGFFNKSTATIKIVRASFRVCLGNSPPKINLKLPSHNPQAVLERGAAQIWKLHHNTLIHSNISGYVNLL